MWLETVHKYIKLVPQQLPLSLMAAMGCSDPSAAIGTFLALAYCFFKHSLFPKGQGDPFQCSSAPTASGKENNEFDFGELQKYFTYKLKEKLLTSPTSIPAIVSIFLPFLLTYELHVPDLPVPDLYPHLSQLPWAAQRQKCSNCSHWNITNQSSRCWTPSDND